MDKTKRKWYKKITDFAAWLVDKNDEFQVKFDKWLGVTGKKLAALMLRLLDKLETRAAKLVVLHDTLQAKTDKRLMVVHYKLAAVAHENQKKLAAMKPKITRYCGVGILAIVACVVIYSHNIGYAYSYNGKVLGYVKDQEEVIKILDMASEELTKEYGADISIDAETDITFDRTMLGDKELDSADTVLKRLTYMSDMQAKSFAIYIDGKSFGACSTKEEAQQVLSDIKAQFTPKGDDIVYEKVTFKENVEIKEENTKLANISTVDEIKTNILSGAEEQVVYVVKAGDTYYDICQAYNTTFDQLKVLNPNLQETDLHQGDEIIMSSAVAAVTIVTVEKSTFAETVAYETEYKDSDAMYKGDTAVSQKGADGKRVVTARITRENGNQTAREDLKSETITEPVKEIILRGTQERPKTAPTGAFSVPVSGYTLSSEFGYRWGRLHSGLDMACATGTTIRASDGGKVVRAGWYSGYGLCIDIDHENGYVTRYGHCSAINVSVGDRVYNGQKIGEVGNTGNSYGSHCHFEIIKNGTPVDPAPYIY